MGEESARRRTGERRVMGTKKGRGDAEGRGGGGGGAVLRWIVAKGDHVIDGVVR